MSRTPTTAKDVPVIDKDNVLHFPTGMACRVIGDTKIYGRNRDCVFWLDEVFSNFESETPGGELNIETTPRELTTTEINWLKRIEAILRNGLPNSDKGVAETIGYAHSEIELLLESIDADWWMK